jgi:hypothetical protein
MFKIKMQKNKKVGRCFLIPPPPFGVLPLEEGESLFNTPFGLSGDWPLGRGRVLRIVVSV